MDITADEKRPNSPPDELLKKGAASDFQWSEEEEKKLLRKYVIREANARCRIHANFHTESTSLLCHC